MPKALIATATLILVAVSCGGSGATDGRAAGAVEPALLGASIDLVEAAPSYRYDLSVTLRGRSDGEVLENEASVATGARAGDRYRVRVDHGPLMRDAVATARERGMPTGILEELSAGDADLTIEVAGDPTVAYVRAPYLAAQEGVTPGPPPAEWAPLVDLDDAWGRVDLTALGLDGPGDVGVALGAQAAPATILEELRSAKELRAIGTDTVRGVAVTGVAAEIPAGDLARVVGNPFSLRTGPAGLGLHADDVAVGVEIWIGEDDGLVRRVTVQVTTEDLRASMGEAGEELAPEFMLETTSTLDLYGYGADLDIELPPADEVVDVTNAFAEYIALG